MIQKFFCIRSHHLTGMKMMKKTIALPQKDPLKGMLKFTKTDTVLPEKNVCCSGSPNIFPIKKWPFKPEIFEIKKRGFRNVQGRPCPTRLLRNSRCALGSWAEWWPYNIARSGNQQMHFSMLKLCSKLWVCTCPTVKNSFANEFGSPFPQD